MPAASRRLAYSVANWRPSKTIGSAINVSYNKCSFPAPARGDPFQTKSRDMDPDERLRRLRRLRWPTTTMAHADDDEDDDDDADADDDNGAGDIDDGAERQ